ncbi:unnamed protein product [Porites lobata]|uniref:G-protein coupled receptors family 1 profile domain-containing protein n=1 Tax=Porites lobata TaxID=104759 RepID=A0ABN8Q3R4_9CNID|nr:unnamed protein product [Porites lobata]
MMVWSLQQLFYVITEEESFCVTLWRRLVKAQASSFVNSHSRKRMTVEVTKMMIVNVALLINNFMIDICLPELLWFGGSLLAYTNSSMNPIIYVVFDSECRKHLL